MAGIILNRTFLPLKRQTKIAAGDILIFYFYLLKKIRLDVSCESSARQKYLRMLSAAVVIGALKVKL